MNNEVEEKTKSEGKKIVFSTEEDERERVTLLSAKRKYWIEWECALDKFPTEDQLEVLDKKLRKYIKKYLDRVSSHKYRDIRKQETEFGMNVEGGSTSGGIFNDIETVIKDAFQDLIKTKDLELEDDKGEENKNKVLIEYARWDGDEWTTVSKKEYGNAVLKNISDDSSNPAEILKYTVYTRKWIDIFKHEWHRVSDAHLVFSYRGWFVTKNNIRLTSEGRGTMNPPDPPPPPK